jgi:UPF0755 protein
MKDRIFKIAGMVVLLSSFILGWYMIEYRAFLRAPLIVPEEGIVFTVESGMSVKQLANKMETQDLLENSGYLVWLARWEGATQKIMAGEYLISPNTTPKLLIEQLTQGKVNLYPFTIVEGWTFKQLMTAINEHDTFQHTLQEMGSEAIMAAIGQPDEYPEGRFYPETYHFPAGTSDKDFLLRSFLAMERELLAEWDKRAINLPIQTPYEALILASIVEKETAKMDEYSKIAGVFVRRLEKNMRLQTDPTVIYGMGENYKGNIRSNDLKSDTPYNTYTRKGLPPTPIAMPGIKAIQAALHPAEGNELYFVSRGDGSHYFSETLEQHNRAVIKYQLQGKKKTFSSLPKPRAKN